MVRLRHSDRKDDAGKPKGKEKRLIFFTRSPLSEALVVGGILLFCCGPKAPGFIMSYGDVSALEEQVDKAVKSQPSKQETMDVLTKITYSRENADDVLGKLDEMAAAGALETPTYLEEGPYGGLGHLCNTYSKDAMKKLPTWRRVAGLIETIWWLGSISPKLDIACRDGVKLLYESGKLNELVAEAKPGHDARRKQEQERLACHKNCDGQK